MSALSPRPHQVRALSDLMAAFAQHDRVLLRMPCGSGKSLIARWHAQASDAGTVLVLVPSLALLAQTLTEWRRSRGWPFAALVVCSDPSTAAGAAERAPASSQGQGGTPPRFTAGAERDPARAPEDSEWTGLRADVTTDPRVVARFLTKDRDRCRRVVFCTYHSAPVVAAAQAATNIWFDLTVCDEAHRLAGRPTPAFRVALQGDAIRSRHRLFMTATDRVVPDPASLSMDDPAVFGHPAHTVELATAIEQGLLCDYRIVVLGITGADVVDEQGSGAPAALLDAIERYSAHRVLTFHGRVAKAAAFATALDGGHTTAGRQVRARHVASGMPASDRAATLTWLAEPTKTQVRVVANARVLTEGVDVPAVDTIVFVDPKSSPVDIVQAVGRVLRPHPDKQMATIIIPIGLPADGDDDTHLLTSRFALLWSVLRALRARDVRIGAELSAAAEAKTSRTGSRGMSRVEFVLPDGLDETGLRLRTVQAVGEAWPRYRAALIEWTDAHPGARLARNVTHQGLGIGEWAAKQRKARTAGLLPEDRRALLEQIPGWYWDRGDAGWEDTYAQLQELAARDGTIAEHDSGTSRFAGMRANTSAGPLLGTWMAQQRQTYRMGALDPARADALQRLPGWTWTPVPARDVAMVDALAQYVEFEKTAAVPDAHLEDGLELGRWCWQVRRRKLNGHLHPALEDEILAATPSRWCPTARGRAWSWEQAETQWRVAYTALRRYAARTGHAAPPQRPR